MNHAIQRLILLKLVQDYANQHGIEYTKDIRTRFSAVAKHIMEHASVDRDAICGKCTEKCEGDACRLS